MRFKVAALVASPTDGTGGRKDVRCDSRRCDTPAQVLEFVVRVLLPQPVKLKDDVLRELFRVGHLASLPQGAA
jgi:hypothetical protein